jgi:hypothetical protein
MQLDVLQGYRYGGILRSYQNPHHISNDLLGCSSRRTQPLPSSQADLHQQQLAIDAYWAPSEADHMGNVKLEHRSRIH